MGTVQAAAVALLALAPATGAAIDDAQFRELTEKLSDATGFKVRLQAAMILGRVGGERAFEPLARALAEDGHYTVRGAAALALANLGDGRAVESLVKSVDADPEPFVARTAEESLAKLAKGLDADAVPFLVAALDHAGPGGRRALVQALAPRNEPQALRALAESLADEEEAVRKPAAEALFHAPANAVGEALITCLEHSSFKVRASAARELGRLKEARGIERLAEMAVDPVEVEEVQKAARDALIAMRSRLDVPQLIKTTADSPDKRERARALALLGAVGGETAYIAAVGALADKDVYVRGISVSVLVALGDPRAVGALQKLLLDETENARILRLVKSAIARLQQKPRSN